MNNSINDASYYTASTSSQSAPRGEYDAPTTSTAVPQSRAQLNREQVVSTNVLFVIAVLLYLFVVIWCRDLTTTGFYCVFSINAALFVTVYCMWINAGKWFRLPTALRRKTHTVNPL